MSNFKTYYTVLIKILTITVNCATHGDVIKKLTSEKRTQPPFLCQLFIQLEEERQEVPVGENGSFLDNVSQSVPQRKMSPRHEVGQDQGGRSAHAHDAVHQHLSCDAALKT